jgi:hypothetical protein
VGQAAIEFRPVEVVFAGSPDQCEQGMAPGVGEGGSDPMRSGCRQTGQSDETHSPDECTCVVGGRISPAPSSIEVVWIEVISCWPKDLRTKSNPLDKEA